MKSASKISQKLQSLCNVCTCVCMCMCLCVHDVCVCGCVYICTHTHVYIPNCSLFYREKVKGVPEDLKILKANKHYLHATELLTITGTQIK